MATVASFFLSVVLIVVQLYTNYAIRCDPDAPSTSLPDLDPNNSALDNCAAGEHYRNFGCSPCEKGTFRTEQMARENQYNQCQKCTEPGEHEIEYERCNATRDTKIMCEMYWYRYQSLEHPCSSYCKQCSICGLGHFLYRSYEAKACSDYSDTICCEDEGMDVVEGKCVAKVQQIVSTTATFHSTTTTAESSTSQKLIITAIAMNKEENSAISDARKIFQKHGFIISLTMVYCVSVNYNRDLKV